MPNAFHWRLRQDRDHDVRVWNEEAVVYDCLTGDTHLLDAVATKIFLHLQKMPATTEMLTCIVAPVLNDPPDACFAVHVVEILDNLKNLSLIETD